MSRFLSVIPVTDAVKAAETIAPLPKKETVPVEASAGRVLASDVSADTDIPGFDRSVVDGYAVRSADTAGAGDTAPALLRCIGRVAMGKHDASLSVGSAECAYIPTGGVLPPGTDAAVMIEYTEVAGDTVLVKKAVSYGENIIHKDEDFRTGQERPIVCLPRPTCQETLFQGIMDYSYQCSRTPVWNVLFRIYG